MTHALADQPSGPALPAFGSGDYAEFRAFVTDVRGEDRSADVGENPLGPGLLQASYSPNPGRHCVHMWVVQSGSRRCTLRKPIAVEFSSEEGFVFARNESTGIESAGECQVEAMDGFKELFFMEADYYSSLKFSETADRGRKLFLFFRDMVEAE